MSLVVERSRKRLPLWLKIIYTLFVIVVIPMYWRVYGPAAFLSLCDFGLLLTCVGMWMESPLLISVNAIALVLPQTIWTFDFISHARLLGLSDYMFKDSLPLGTRLLSTFHIWLPVMLLILLLPLGYDRRAVWLQSLIIAGLLIASYLFTDPRHPPSGYSAPVVNVNRVYGKGETEVQTKIPPPLYIAIETVGIVVCLYLPAHLLLCRMYRKPNSRLSTEPAAPAPQPAAQT